MKKNELFYTAIAIIPIGFTLIGIGVGRLLNEYWAGTLVGLGIGIEVSTIIMLKVVSRLNFQENK